MKNKDNYNYPKVSIIILNWNSWKDTIECIESLYQINYPDYDVIIVDNGSEDNSIEKIKEYTEGKIKVESPFFEYKSKNKPIKIIETVKEIQYLKDPHYNIKEISPNKKMILLKNDKNYGYTEGNNIGMRYAMEFLYPQYILLLNNDTVVEKDFLLELTRAAENDLNSGFFGPKIYFYDYNGSKDIIQFAGAKQNLWKFEPYHIGFREKDIGKYDLDNKADYIHGSCILSRVEMINEIGLLDESYFSYREENDWCMRGYQKGWNSKYIFKAKIWHKGGGSTNNGPSRLINAYYMTRNRFLFMKKYANNLQKISFLLYFLGFDFWFKGGIYIIIMKDLASFRSFFRGFIDGFKLLIRFNTLKS